MQEHRMHDAEHAAMAAAHEGHGGKTSGGHDRHAGHTTGMFRSRFWVSLALSVPVVLYSDMIQMWLGFSMPRFPGSGWVAPILGTFIFAWGGWPFLKGGFEEARERRPGMMLLISLAITVAFVASVATALGFLDLDFWWELALLVTIMLLGHWMEMRAVGQASGALEALAALLPDEAERVTGGTTEKVSLEDLGEGDVVLVRSGGRVPADGETL
jgi:Cu2+-exporting ATPase